MPLFIFMSGYFSHKKNPKEFLLSIWKLLEPFLIFHIMARIIFNGGLTWNNLLTPWWLLWYLLSLIYWRVILQMIPDRILNNTKLILTATFSIGIFAGFLPFDRFLSLQRTLAFCPFSFDHCDGRSNTRRVLYSFCQLLRYHYSFHSI